MIKWLAEVAPLPMEGVVLWCERLAPSGFCINSAQEGLCIGLQNPVERLSLTMVRRLMEIVSEIPTLPNTRLSWLFSGQSLAVADIAALLAAWERDNHLPLLSIIQLEFGERHHRTRGLAAFIGHECAALFEAVEQSRDAAINLGLLARRALLSGGLDSNAHYAGFDEAPLVIEWPAARGPDAMVTIILPTVRNGPALH
jgi:hypothetical protein